MGEALPDERSGRANLVDVVDDALYPPWLCSGFSNFWTLSTRCLHGFYSPSGIPLYSSSFPTISLASASNLVKDIKSR